MDIKDSIHIFITLIIEEKLSKRHKPPKLKVHIMQKCLYLCNVVVHDGGANFNYFIYCWVGCKFPLGIQC